MFSVDALTSSAGVPANENNKRRSNIDEEDHRCDAYAATRSTYDKKLATKKSRLSVHTEVVPAAINIDNVPAGSEMGGDPNGGKGSASADGWLRNSAPPPLSSHIHYSFDNSAFQHSHQISATSTEQRYLNTSKNQAPWDYLNAVQHDIVGLEDESSGMPLSSPNTMWVEPSVTTIEARGDLISYVAPTLINKGPYADDETRSSRSNEIFVNHELRPNEKPAEPNVSVHGSASSCRDADQLLSDSAAATDEIDAGGSKAAEAVDNRLFNVENPSDECGTVLQTTPVVVQEVAASSSKKSEDDPYEYTDADFDAEDAMDDEATLAEDEAANGAGDDDELDDLRALGEMSVDELRKRFNYATEAPVASSSAEYEEQESSSSRPRRGCRRQDGSRGSAPFAAAIAENESVKASVAAVDFNAAELRSGDAAPASGSESVSMVENDRPSSLSGLKSISVLIESTKPEQNYLESLHGASNDEEADDIDFDEEENGEADTSTETETEDTDDDDDDDKDYVPPQKPTQIRCGSNYQAVVPEVTLDTDITTHYAGLAEVLYDFAQWKPATIDEELVVAYQMAAMKQFSLFTERGICEMNKAISDLTPFIHHVRQHPPNHFEPFPDHEDLLRQLMISANNLRVGLQRCYIERLPRQDSSLGWLDEESQRFEEALLRFDKNFRAISRHVKTRSVKECVYFYYERKRSARYERNSSVLRSSSFSTLYTNSAPPGGVSNYSGGYGTSAGWNANAAAPLASSNSAYNTRLRNANINVPLSRQQQQQGLLFGVNIPYPPPSRAVDNAGVGSSSSWAVPSMPRYSGASSRQGPYTAAAAQRRSTANTASQHQHQQQLHAANHGNRHAHNFHRPCLQAGLNPIHHSHEEQRLGEASSSTSSNYAAATQTQRMGTNTGIIIVPNRTTAGGKFFAPTSPTLPQAVSATQGQLPPMNFSSATGSENSRSDISLTTFGLAGANSGSGTRSSNSLSSAFSATSSNGSASLVGTMFASLSTMMLARQQQSPLTTSPTAAAGGASKFFGTTTPLPNNNFLPDINSTTNSFVYCGTSGGNGDGK